jgi:hypothetical protein
MADLSLTLDLCERSNFFFRLFFILGKKICCILDLFQYSLVFKYSDRSVSLAFAMTCLCKALAMTEG